MNNKDFYDEVLSSEYCPECFSTIYQDFQKYQEMTMNTLKEFHYICEKNEIPYELAYGSLLGAIRHGGSIPWDYDVDVFVPFEYREKLVEVLKKDLKQEFYFYCPESYNTCRHYFIRITPIGMRSEVLHIDVFFLTGVPNSPGEINIYQQEIKKLSKIRFHKLVDIKTESAGSLKRMIRLAIKKIKYLFVSLESIDKRYWDICSRNKALESECCISTDTFSDYCVLNGKDVWNTKIIQTDDGEFRIPVNYEKILETMYGDFMSIPPLKNRIDELLYHYNRIKWFEKNVK